MQNIWSTTRYNDENKKIKIAKKFEKIQNELKKRRKKFCKGMTQKFILKAQKFIKLNTAQYFNF